MNRYPAPHFLPGETKRDLYSQTFRPIVEQSTGAMRYKVVEDREWDGTTYGTYWMLDGIRYAKWSEVMAAWQAGKKKAREG